MVETIRIVDKVVKVAKVAIITEVEDHKVKTSVTITTSHNHKDGTLIEIAVTMAVLVAATMVSPIFFLSVLSDRYSVSLGSSRVF